MMNQLFTTKLIQKQEFVNAKRLPVTVLNLPLQLVTALKDKDKDGYYAAQIAIGKKNLKPNKPQAGHLKASKLDYKPRWTREVRLTDASEIAVGASLPFDQIIGEGDKVKATATSKGKGFSGVMKRHGFHGGPKTHGQSDRARAPGSIGRGTTPGRVVKGKNMAGRMGGDTVSISGLKILKLDLEAKQIIVSGLIPGARGGLVRLTVTKKNPNPVVKQEVQEIETEIEAATQEIKEVEAVQE